MILDRNGQPAGLRSARNDSELARSRGHRSLAVRNPALRFPRKPSRSWRIRAVSFANYPSLKGRVVFITGGGSGIGAAMVEAFVAQNASVAFVDILEAESRVWAEGLGKRGAPPLFLPCDLMNVAALRAAIAEVGKRMGPIGVLI